MRARAAYLMTSWWVVGVWVVLTILTGVITVVSVLQPTWYVRYTLVHAQALQDVTFQVVVSSVGPLGFCRLLSVESHQVIDITTAPSATDKEETSTVSTSSNDADQTISSVAVTDVFKHRYPTATSVPPTGEPRITVAPFQNDSWRREITQEVLNEFTTDAVDVSLLPEWPPLAYTPAGVEAHGEAFNSSFIFPSTSTSAPPPTGGNSEEDPDDFESFQVSSPEGKDAAFRKSDGIRDVLFSITEKYADVVESDSERYEYVDPGRSEYMDPDRPGHLDPDRSIYAVPDKSEYGGLDRPRYPDQDRSVYKDPNRSIYVDPDRSLYADPDISVYADPDRPIYADPGKSIYTYPTKSIYTDPNRSTIEEELGRDTAPLLLEGKETGKRESEIDSITGNESSIQGETDEGLSAGKAADNGTEFTTADATAIREFTFHKHEGENHISSGRKKKKKKRKRKKKKKKRRRNKMKTDTFQKEVRKSKQIASEDSFGELNHLLVQSLANANTGDSPDRNRNLSISMSVIEEGITAQLLIRQEKLTASEAGSIGIAYHPRMPILACSGVTVGVSSGSSAVWVLVGVVYGVAGVVQVLAGVASIISQAVRSPAGRYAHAIWVGNIQVAVVMSQGVTLVLFPLGLGSPLARVECGGNSSVYWSGDCTFGWAYMLAIVGTTLAAYCPCLARLTVYKKYALREWESLNFF